MSVFNGQRSITKKRPYGPSQLISLVSGVPDEAGRTPRSEVVFAVLTGAEHHDDRAAIVKETWCSQLDACAARVHRRTLKRAPRGYGWQLPRVVVLLPCSTPARRGHQSGPCFSFRAKLQAV